MKDCLNRDINYIRISVTDRCNLRCVYCMPKEGPKGLPKEEILTFEEITRVCRQAAALGISKVKITGGEPLVRKDIPVLIGMLHKVPGIQQVTLTSNGILLAEHMEALKENGLDGINISLDCLDPEKYGQLTRGGRLEDALAGLEAAIASGIPVKVNTVLHPGQDWQQLLELARKKPVCVRFIETMPIGMGKSYTGASKEDVLRYCESQGIILTEDQTPHGNGPAVYYKAKGFLGQLGIIAPIHGKFCDSCNRIRLTAAGRIKPCLCYGESFDLRSCIREGTEEEIREMLRQAILSKPAAHSFSEEQAITETKMMSEIGG